MSAESEAETMEKTVYKSVDEMPILMSAEDIAATGICGKNKAYDLFHIKGFPFLQIGNRKVVPKEAFLAWIRKRVEEDTGFRWEDRS